VINVIYIAIDMVYWRKNIFCCETHDNIVHVLYCKSICESQLMDNFALYN